LQDGNPRTDEYVSNGTCHALAKSGDRRDTGKPAKWSGRAWSGVGVGECAVERGD
jgi:hypothetical protein